MRRLLASLRALVPELARACGQIAGRDGHDGGEGWTTLVYGEGPADLVYGEGPADPALAHCLIFAVACRQVEMRLTGRDIAPEAFLEQAMAAQPAAAALLRLWRTDGHHRPLLRRVEAELSARVLLVDELVPLFEGLLGTGAPEVRRRLGIFHTPAVLCRFMVEQADAALKECGLRDGLLDNCTYADLELSPPSGLEVEQSACIVLDPAAGLGVFVAEVIRHAAAALRDGSGLDEERMQALLGRVRAVEVLPPLQLSSLLFLRCVLCEQGYDPALLAGCELRCGDYLRAVVEQQPWLRGVNVVLGNPPYARSSANKGPALRALLAPYRVGLDGERNLQPLADDYIKFMRAVEVVLAPAPNAVFCLVTNHSYLRGRLHRAMRRSLRSSFERLDLLDLHGNTKIRQVGRRDENIFGIAQGVAVTLAARGAQLGPGRVTYRELRGRRQDKLDAIEQRRFPPARHINRTQCKFSPCEPLPREYDQFVPLSALFDFYSVGGKPGDDGMLVGFESEQLLSQLRSARTRLEDEVGRCTEAARRLSQRPLSEPFDEDGVIHYAYRPFDERVAYYEPRIWTRPLRQLYARVDGRPILLTTRIVKDEDFAHVFVTRRFPDVIALSPTSSVNCYAFPMATMEPEPLRKATGMCLSAEEAFAYVYAALHSRTYRQRYVGGLRDDFPRIPVMRDPALIASLVARGGRLLALHLGEATPKTERPRFVDGGDRSIRCEVPHDATSLLGEEGNLKLGLNEASAFEAVPETAWSFRVGGYQVCRKWLLDRRRAGRDLSDGDVDRFCDLVARIQETVILQRDIDALIDRFGGFPQAVLPLSK